MRTGRRDYDTLIRTRGIPAGEPTFLLRAQDRNAADGVRAYAALCYERHVSPALVEMALQQADEMAAWPHQKSPDIDDLTPDEVKQLVYQLSRRAWASKPGYSPCSAMLAFQKGRDEAAGEARGERDALREALADMRQENAALIAQLKAARDPARIMAALNAHVFHGVMSPWPDQPADMQAAWEKAVAELAAPEPQAETAHG